MRWNGASFDVNGVDGISTTDKVNQSKFHIVGFLRDGDTRR